jgi:uncharacterized protein YbjQ (UPF0145 family)
MQCSRCGKALGVVGGIAALMTAPNPTKLLCPECEATLIKEQRQAEAAERQAAQTRRQELEARARRIVLTTTPTVDGQRVSAYLGIESVEIVIGTGLFSELSGELSDFFGQRSKAFEGKLREAKSLAFQILRTRAAAREADAVVAIDLDYTEFSGNRVALIVNGTLVQLAAEFGEAHVPPEARRAGPPPLAK